MLYPLWSLFFLLVSIHWILRFHSDNRKQVYVPCEIWKNVYCTFWKSTSQSVWKLKTEFYATEPTVAHMWFDSTYPMTVELWWIWYHCFLQISSTWERPEDISQVRFITAHSTRAVRRVWWRQWCISPPPRRRPTGLNLLPPSVYYSPLSPPGVPIVPLPSATSPNVGCFLWVSVSEGPRTRPPVRPLPHQH